MKKIRGVYSAPAMHWVGDGFPVRSIFSYDGLAKDLSPFLLLDYTGTAEFGPARRPRGVGQHPHRGFETVTIVYKGEVAHRDSTGQAGVIGPGDVQWMTAAAGILHEEFHSEAFTSTGGELDMAQLWVNLPAKMKMSAPAYQAIESKNIPAVALAGGAGTARIIAGNHGGQTGPAHTFSPLHVWDLRLNPGIAVDLPAAEGWTTAVIVLHGTVVVNGSSVANEAQLVLLERDGSGFQLEANSDAVVLFLSGEPLNEPIVGHGPFVMNTETEIIEAIDDFRNGRFGQMDR